MKLTLLKALTAAVILFTWQSPAQNVVFEPGSGVISAPFILTNGILSQSVQAGATTRGRAVYNFALTNGGRYALQAVVNAPAGTANAFSVNIDAEPEVPAMTWDIPATSGFTSQFVTWRSGGTQAGPSGYKIFNLTSGSHQLIIRGNGGNAQLQRLSLLPLPAAPTGLRIVAGP
jgi:hypothetical protein